jgi:hypothetical protein
MAHQEATKCTCEWCSRSFTSQRTGPGRPPPSCSDACKRAAQNSLAAQRMRRLRERERERNPHIARPADPLVAEAHGLKSNPFCSAITPSVEVRFPRLLDLLRFGQQLVDSGLA